MIPRRMLIVEDDAALLRGLRDRFENQGFQIRTATDGESALQKAAEARPDLILMDLSLPRLDGWEATRRLKADEQLKAIPVIVLSAHAMRGDEERARASGCDDFLTKPIDEALLFEKLERHLGS